MYWDRCQEKVEKKLIGEWNVAFDPATVWRSTNTTPVSQLLRQFFRFFAEFPAEVDVLCPLMGRPLKRTTLTGQLVGVRVVWPAIWADFFELVNTGRVEPLVADTALVVQDPVELNRNVACNYSKLGLDWFRQCCREAASTPLSGLFTEQPLPKMKKVEEAVAAAAVAAGAVRRSAGSVGGSTAAGAALSVASDSALLDHVVADLRRSPDHVVTVPLKVPGHIGHTTRSGPLTETERNRHAAAFAHLLQDLFSVAMRFQCRRLSFDGLRLDRNVVGGYECSVRLPIWEFRTKVTTLLSPGRRRTVDFESEVTELALRRAGKSVPKPLAAFSCYLELEGDELQLSLYKKETDKAGKNCFPFLPSFLRKLARRLDHVTLFGED